MGFRKIEKNTINYQPPTNDSLRLVSGNTALVTVINQVIPISGITNIGAGPGYIYKQTQNQIAEMMGISGNTNISITYNSTGDTVGVNLNDNIIVNSISASTIYSGSTDLSLLIGGGSGSFTQQYVSGSTGSQSLISISPAGTGNIAEQNSIVLSKNSSGLSTYSTIIGGSNNLINSGADYSLISGKNNTISQPYAGLTFNHILGSNNQSNGSYINIIGNYNSGFTSNSNLRGKSNLIQGTYFGIYQLLYSTYGLNNIAGARNQIINAGLSNIHNGFNNKILNSTYSSILNGNNNYISKSDLSIIQGFNNKTYDNSYSIIFGGGNIITTATTFNGYFNTIFGSTNFIKDTKNSSIFGGILNRISGSTIITTGNNLIIQGDRNEIQGSRSSILNGFNNFILNDSQDSTIISGQDNFLRGGQNSIIFNGKLNNINYSTGVTLINVSNITTTSADTNLLITNQIKSIALTGASTQMVVADSSGLLSVQAIPSGGTGTALFSGTTPGGIKQIYPGDTNVANDNNAISFGKNNKVYNKHSIITNGYYNLISALGSYSSINNGVYNSINSFNFNLIGNGSQNYISGVTNYQSVINGKRNKIYSSYFASINNGSGNYITSSNHSTILGGYKNAVTNNKHSTILNGSYNIIICTGSTDGNVIVNGDHNQIQSSLHSAILAGKYNVLSNSNYSSIISGSYNNFSGDNTAFGDKLQLKSLTGATTKMVVASTNGLLGIQNIPTSNSVNNGINTFTAGTSSFQSVNVTALTINTLTASGNSIVSANFSANTIFSGTSNLNTLFVTPGQLSASQTFVQPGINTYTGGTALNPTVNVSALTINNLTVSGTTSLNTLSATTLQIRNLSGVTTRMVVANTSGVLSSQAIPPTYAQYWTVGGVASAMIQNNGYNTASADFSIAAGKLNVIGTNSTYSSILGGISNKNYQNSKYSAIVSGSQNKIKDYSSNSFIGAGRIGYIYNSNYSSILNGNANKIYNSSSNSESNFNTILGGYQTKIIRAMHSTVLGGYLSTIGTVGGNLIKYSLVFGRQNYVQADYSAIIGGQGYVLTENNTLLTPKLKIGNLPTTSSTYLLNTNSYGNVYKIGFSGGTGIKVNNSSGLLTITYTGSTSSGGGATVNNGINTFTAGTSSFQSVNVTALTIDNLTVSATTNLNTLSATTLQVRNLSGTTTRMVVAYSGGTLSATTIPKNFQNFKESTLPSNGTKRYYRNTPVNGGLANGTFNANNIVLTPFYVGKNCDIQEMQINVTTTGGTGVFALAVYDNYSPGGLFPGNLKQSFGSGQTSPTGIKSLTASTAVNYTPGMYWIALWNSTSFAINVTSNNSYDLGATSSNFTIGTSFTSAATYSNTFPATMSGVTTIGTAMPAVNYHMKAIYD